MMRGDPVQPEQLRQMARRPLGHAAGVDEQQRRAMRRDEFGHLLVDLLPLVVGHHCRERRRRHHQSQVALLRIADVDDPAIGPAVLDRRRADQKARDLVDRLLGCRQPDSDQGSAMVARGKRLEALERQRQMTAALAGRHRVDLIDDDAAHRTQHAAAAVRAKQDVERLGGGHQDMRRPAPRQGAITLRRIAGAHGGADVDVHQAQACQLVPDSLERRLEVEADVVGQRLQRRDVEDDGFLRQPSGFEPVAHQGVDRGQEGGEGLS
jgi:hypothetical protein